MTTLERINVPVMLEPTPFEIAHRRLRLLGVELKRFPGEYPDEYRTGYHGSNEDGWAGFEGLEAAVAHGEALAAAKPLATPASGKRRRRGKPVYRTVKAALKAKRKAHARIRWAAVFGKIISR